MVTPNLLKKLYTQLEARCRTAGLIVGKSGRHMKYPYTLSAKIAQFPYFYYMKQNSIWMYYPLGCLLASFAFYKIHKWSNSEVNVKTWAETQRKMAEKEHHI